MPVEAEPLTETGPSVQPETLEGLVADLFATPALRRALSENNNAEMLGVLPFAVAGDREYAAKFYTAYESLRLWRDDLADGFGSPIIRPPDFYTFVHSDAYIGLENDGHKLTERQLKLLREGMDFDPAKVFDIENKVTEVVALYGKGSGKDTMSSLVLAWVTFVINSLRDPWQYFNQIRGDAFDIINIATTSEQANSVFFNKLKARLKRPCFAQFKPHIGKALITFYREMPGQDEPTLLLQVHSLHAKAESWEGKNLLFWVMDEADGFEDQSGKSNADICHNVLVTSARTRFVNRWKGFIISYKRQQDGFMDRMISWAKKAPGVVWDQATTFEVLPFKSRADFAEDYERDFEDALCKYENIAPAVVGAFFTYPERIDMAVDNNRRQVCDFQEITTTRVVNGVAHQFVALEISNIVGNMDRHYFMHGDPGETDASFALGMCHVETGWAVGRGHDNILNDFYMGHILVNQSNHPVGGAVVIYYDQRTGQEVTRAFTDREGKHTVWLRPGVYTYGFYDRNGMIGQAVADYQASAGVDVLVPVDDSDGDGEGVADLSLAEANPTADREGRYVRKRVYPVVEDLLLEWKPKPGMPVDYDNVQKTIETLRQYFNIYICSFDQFDSPQMIQNLMSGGLNAVKVTFNQKNTKTIFTAFRSLVYSGLWMGLGSAGGKPCDRRLYQLRGLRRKGTQILPREGEWKDLADACATSAWHATRIAGAVVAAETGLSSFAPATQHTPGSSIMPGGGIRLPIRGNVVTQLGTGPFGQFPHAVQQPMLQSAPTSQIITSSPYPENDAAPNPNLVPGLDDRGQAPPGSGYGPSVPYR